MSDTDDVVALLRRWTPRSAVELRDALRSKGRVSITTADIVRALTANPGRFVAAPRSDEQPCRWQLAPEDLAASEARPSIPGTNWFGPPLFLWQEEALAAWRMRARRGVIEAVTGTGKTMVGVAAAVEELARGGQACVLVPSRDLMYQWQSVLRSVLPAGFVLGLVGDGHRVGLESSDVTIAVVNSAREADLRPRRPGGLLVADECHRYGSDGNRVVLRTSFPYRLGLSATYARSDDGHLDWLDPYFGGRCFRMGYRRALADRVVAPFIVAFVGVTFSAEEMADYSDLGLLMAKARAMILRSGLVRPEPFGAFLADVARLSGGSGGVSATAMAYLGAMAERRRLLSETPAKVVALQGLAPAFAAADRAIAFTRSIAAADEAAVVLQRLGLRAAPVHSALAGGVRRATLGAFSAGSVQVVTAPSVLDEGIDVPAADLAVILAASQSQRQMVQRMGRVLRRKAGGRHARFVIVYVEGTAEDPVLGAHEGFLDEIVPLAADVRSFAAGSPWSHIVSYLSSAAQGPQGPRARNHDNGV